jgi:hypothetical protein
MNMSGCLDLTGPKSVARTTLDGMSDSNKLEVDKEINKSLKKKINKEVKDTILDIAHRELLDELLMKHLTFSVAPVEEMVHYLKPTMQELMGTNNAIKVGDWCEVLYDYAPGTCSDGGVGEVMVIDEDAEGVRSCRVSYVLDKRIETGITLNRITVTMMPYKDATSINRTRREQDISSSNILPDRVVAAPDKTSLQWLESGLKSRNHEKPGWLKEKLLHHGLLEATDEALWQRVLSDYKCQLSAIEGMRLALGPNFTDPREHKGDQGEGGKFVSLKKASQADVPKNMWTIPFLLHAYDVKRSNFQNKQKNDKLGVSKLTEGMKKRVIWNKGQCVITNRVASRKKYNARYFFSRMKALNVATIPKFKEGRLNAPAFNHELFRQREWNFFTTRVQIYSY